MRVLLNHVYYSPVGHVVEAIQLAKGLFDGNPGAQVSVALGDDTAWELCDACPWIAATYRIPVSDPDTLAIPELSREWDYIVDNNLMAYEDQHVGELTTRPPGYRPPRGPVEQATLAYFARTDAELVATRGRGVLTPTISLPEGLRMAANPRVELAVPAASRRFARRYAGPGPRICLLPAGSGPARQYPDAQSWLAIIAALRARFPTARFHLTGARASPRNQTTTSFAAADVDRILAADVVDCMDIGLWHQVALFQTCDLLVAPHTGFAFLALCVGTPWLALAGGNWPEYFHNHVPFYSVLPDNPNYPYLGGIDDYPGPRIPDMWPDRLRSRIPDLLAGAEFLLDPATTYADACRRHRENIARANIRHDRMPTFAN